MLSILLGIYPQVQLLGHTVILWLTLTSWGPVILFTSVTTPFYIPISNAWGFGFLHILTNTSFLPFFHNGHPIGYEVVGHGFLICISLMNSDVEHLSCAYWPKKIAYLLWGSVCSRPLPTFHLGCLVWGMGNIGIFKSFQMCLTPSQGWELL